MPGKPELVTSHRVKLSNSGMEDRVMIERHLRSLGNELSILEAGCGRSWPLHLDGIALHLTGIDLDERALSARRDLERAIVADLKSVPLPKASFDAVYSAFVVEHVHGAETALRNLAESLRPGGLMILQFPDRNTTFGFLTRWTPHWFHVLWKRWIEGNKTAGMPGHGPYPVAYDSICSIGGIRKFCQANNFEILEERGHGYYMNRSGGSMMRMIMRATSMLSLGKLEWRYNNLTLILRKVY